MLKTILAHVLFLDPLEITHQNHYT
jgi:hypothetical protein